MSNWIKVTDQAPPKFEVILFTPNGAELYVGISPNGKTFMAHKAAGKRAKFRTMIAIDDVTHWQKAPEPPTDLL